MKIILVAFVYIFSLSMPASALEAKLLERWEFQESWKSVDGQQSEFVVYELSVIDQVSGVLEVQGYQTYEKMAVKILRSGGVIKVILDSYMEKGLNYRLSKGDILFELALNKDKPPRTTWGKLKPSLDVNSHSGVYFKRGM